MRALRPDPGRDPAELAVTARISVRTRRGGGGIAADNVESPCLPACVVADWLLGSPRAVALDMSWRTNESDEPSMTWWTWC